MKKKEMAKKAMGLAMRTRTRKTYSVLIHIERAIEQFEARISGKRDAEDKRDIFFEGLEKLYRKDERKYLSQSIRKSNFEKNSALELAAKANLRTDEHSSWDRGDHLTVKGIDFVGFWKSKQKPYFDMGGEGLGLVEVTRKRVYARTSRYSPSYVSTKFLVGKNEIGTYFSHPVVSDCNTVKEALQWMWGGRAYDIIQRQGDIALIKGKGPKIPNLLPDGHKVDGDFIVHETHPSLPYPKKGERVIVGRRAAERASEATRD